MSVGFSEAFSRLRKERGISQRQAAADLGMSQALLSHYENGLREPKLDFIVKACEYYNVSADYLLGRTQMRANPMSDFAWNGKNVDRLMESIACLLNSMEDETAVTYLEGAVFKLCGCGNTGEQMLCDGYMKLTEAELTANDSTITPNDSLNKLLSEMRERLKEYKR